MTTTPFPAHRLRTTVRYLGDADEMVSCSVTFKPFVHVPADIMAIEGHEDRVWAMFEWALSSTDFAVVEQLAADEFDRVLREWVHSGAEDTQRFVHGNAAIGRPINGC